MNYTQLVPANPNTAGTAGLCLSYVENVFGAPHEFPTAWVAWSSAKFKHTDTPPSSVSVPVWFSWTGTIDGVTENYGHVAAWVNGQIHSTSAQGIKVFNSIQDLLNFMGDGMKYLGWSEDIAGKRVVQVVAQPATHTATVIREANVRVAPNLKAALGGSRVLKPHETFQYTEMVTGEMVTENGITSDQWAHSKLGHYIWAGNLKVNK